MDKYCAWCGAQNQEAYLFCVRCGRKFADAEHAETPRGREDSPSGYYGENTHSSGQWQYRGTEHAGPAEGDARTREEMRFVERNTDYYTRVFHRIRVMKKAASWNWAAYFAGEFWFFYRKMHSEGAIVLLLWFFLSLLGAIGGTGVRIIGFILRMALYIYTGAQGNAIYMKYVEEGVEKARDWPQGEVHYYMKYGGVFEAAIPMGIVTAIITAVIF